MGIANQIVKIAPQTNKMNSKIAPGKSLSAGRRAENCQSTGAHVPGTKILGIFLFIEIVY